MMHLHYVPYRLQPDYAMPSPVRSSDSEDESFHKHRWLHLAEKVVDRWRNLIRRRRRLKLMTLGQHPHLKDLASSCIGIIKGFLWRDGADSWVHHLGIPVRMWLSIQGYSVEEGRRQCHIDYSNRLLNAAISVSTREDAANYQSEHGA